MVWILLLLLVASLEFWRDERVRECDITARVSGKCVHFCLSHVNVECSGHLFLPPFLLSFLFFSLPLNVVDSFFPISQFKQHFSYNLLHESSGTSECRGRGERVSIIIREIGVNNSHSCWLSVDSLLVGREHVTDRSRVKSKSLWWSRWVEWKRGRRERSRSEREREREREREGDQLKRWHKKWLVSRMDVHVRMKLCSTWRVM